MYMKDVKTFFDRVVRKKGKKILPETIHPDFLMSTIGKRAEFARDLLESDFFTETIALMNEEVVQDIASCDPLDTDRLVMLRLRLQTIQDFSFRVVAFVDEHEQAAFEQEQELQRQREAERAA